MVRGIALRVVAPVVAALVTAATSSARAVPPAGAAPAEARPSAAPPLLLVASQRLGGGYDSNPAYDRNPALSPPPDVLRTAAPLGERAVLAGETSLGAYLGDAWWAGLALDLDGRWYLPGGADHEARLDSTLGAKGGWESDVFAASLSLEGNRYADSFGADNAWSGRAVVRGVVKAASVWHVGAQVGGSWRGYDSGGQQDRGVSGGVDLAYRPPDGYALIGVELDRRDSTEATAIRTEFAPHLDAGLTAGPVSIDARYLLLARRFDEPNQDGIEHVVKLDTIWWLAPWIGPFVRGEVGVARGEMDALAYERFAVIGGITARLAPQPSARDLQRRSVEDQGPAALKNGRVRFRVHLPAAHEASVIGTFNAWSTESGALRSVGGGWFEADLAVPPGRHRYHFVVDGRVVRPSGAPAYAPDDFGGEDAVLIVPEAGE